MPAPTTAQVATVRHNTSVPAKFQMASSEATTATTMQALVIQKANLVTTRGLRKPRFIIQSRVHLAAAGKITRSARTGPRSVTAVMRNGSRRAHRFVLDAFLRLPRRDPDRDCNCEHRGISPLRNSARCETEATSLDQRTK